jgi:polysaccharide deacetylase family protein (PEP-CTERM system associated)
MKAFVTVDVEDWFNSSSFRNIFPPSKWDAQENRLANGLDFILDELEARKIEGTFFCLGYSARRNPDLIRKIAARGHEIGSHGFFHDCVYDMKPEAFRQDLRDTAALLEDLSGEKMLGYRAPNFSITDFGIEILKEEGYLYDSSHYPFAAHDKYGKPEKLRKDTQSPYKLSENFWEFPMSSLKLSAATIPWSGGGYFRLFPQSVFFSGIKKIVKESPFNFYIHPWEFDPGQPRIEELSRFTKFRHYNNLNKTRDRFRKMLDLTEFTSIRNYIRAHS